MKPGNLVRANNGKTYRVSGVQGDLFGGKPWVEGQMVRKDGTVCRRKRNLKSGWEPVKL